MRESEVLELKWEDFGTEAEVIRMRCSLYRGKINAPKTEGSGRVIPYGDRVLSVTVHTSPQSTFMIEVVPRTDF